MTLARGEREWALLVSEYNICKKKLESKRQALKILMGDLESCQRERDIYKNKIKQMQQEIENYKKKELENDSKSRRSPSSPSIRSPEHFSYSKSKKERKFSGQTIWEQELQSVRDRKNKTLSQLLCESKEENKALKNDFMDLRVLYREAQEDIILLRENVSRQKISEKGFKMDNLEARQELIQQLEKIQGKREELERELQGINDEKSEIVNERDHYRDKVDRLNTQLNFILGADDRRLVDIDAILMENRYQKEQIKQLKEEIRIANASLVRHKAAVEKRKARLAKAGYHAGSGSSFTGPSAAKQTLPSLIAEISSSFSHNVSSSTINDLQFLANSLSESLSEKDLALLHQRNTNKILGTRVAELEKKLKTLEVSGLWSLDGHRGYGSEDLVQLYLEKLRRSTSTLNNEPLHDSSKELDPSLETDLPSAECSLDSSNGESVFFNRDILDNDQELIGTTASNFTSTISEEEDGPSNGFDINSLDEDKEVGIPDLGSPQDDGGIHDEDSFPDEGDSHEADDASSSSFLRQNMPKSWQNEHSCQVKSSCESSDEEAEHKQGNFPVESTSFTPLQKQQRELELTENEEHFESDLKVNFVSNPCTSKQDNCNNNSKQSSQSSERSLLNSEGSQGNHYGAMITQDHPSCSNMINVCTIQEESVSDYFEPDGSSLDDVEDQAN